MQVDSPIKYENRQNNNYYRQSNNFKGLIITDRIIIIFRKEIII